MSHKEKSEIKIVVLGVSDGSCDAINQMIASELSYCQFLSLSANTLMGETSEAEIKVALQDADIVMMVAGGDGCITIGDLPVIAKIAKDIGAFTFALITEPFNAEEQTEITPQAITDIQKMADCTLMVSNDKTLTTGFKDIGVGKNDDHAVITVQQIVETINSLCNHKGLIGISFADIKWGLGASAIASVGVGEGPNRAIQAVENAVSNLGQDAKILKKSTGTVVRISGSTDFLGLSELEEVSRQLTGLLSDDVVFIVGAFFDDSLGRNIRVDLIVSR